MVLPLPKLRVAARELSSVARHAFMPAERRRHEALPSNLQPDDDVVVCLHGLLGDPKAWRPLRRRLDRHERLHTVTMRHAVGSPVRVLARQLGELLAELPSALRIHLLGHSLGGVVARYFVQKHDDPRVVQTISLASPFAGAGAGMIGAKLGIELAAELSPGSPLLRELVMGSKRRLGLPHLSIVAEQDGVLSAPLSHALPGGEVVRVQAVGHNALLFDEGVAVQIERRVLEHILRRSR